MTEPKAVAPARELCSACAGLECTICHHEACSVCVDSCDHPACIDWDAKGQGNMTHKCVFPPCPKGCDREAIAKALAEEGAEP